ncbi:MAG: hypothetical protein CMH67_08290 [Nisaea sp.]|jgi:hypothetical protein|nr:hypothetical protein [Nisaea sp.]|tara:strand:- start:40 stop:324 length:285 start_codon:yes stop_codon:yes gene_type:complete
MMRHLAVVPRSAVAAVAAQRAALMPNPCDRKNAAMSMSKTKAWGLIAVLLTLPVLSGCGAIAAPCRVAEAGARAVPVVGGAVGAVFEACAEVLD